MQDGPSTILRCTSPADLKAEVQRISIQESSKVPGRRYPPDPIRATSTRIGAGLCRMLDTKFREGIF
jgi:hypothetical protein